jgi:hypothetical protein
MEGKEDHMLGQDVHPTRIHQLDEIHMDKEGNW